MTIAPGVRLGPYEVIAALGSGGMGEVYRARDTRLDRTVAIKVLPAALASASELRERFEREARAISSLQHPHICALFDVGRDGDADFLVLEDLDGETLADHLVRTGRHPQGRTAARLDTPADHAACARLRVSTCLARDADVRYQVSQESGGDPTWRHNGKELFFLRQDDGTLMAAAVETRRGFETAAARAVFSAECGDDRHQFWQLRGVARRTTVPDQQPARTVQPGAAHRRRQLAQRGAEVAAINVASRAVRDPRCPARARFASIARDPEGSSTGPVRRQCV